MSYVDLLGTTYSSPSIATGYGAYIAVPLLRAAVDGKQDQLTEDAAKKILHECMRVLFYRDARSLDKVRSLPYSPNVSRAFLFSYGDPWNHVADSAEPL